MKNIFLENSMEILQTKYVIMLSSASCKMSSCQENFKARYNDLKCMLCIQPWKTNIIYFRNAKWKKLSFHFLRFI